MKMVFDKVRWTELIWLRIRWSRKLLWTQ